jgi:hypothetical protein
MSFYILACLLLIVYMFFLIYSLHFGNLYLKLMLFGLGRNCFRFSKIYYDAQKAI